jgi:hypothetical protein
LEEARVLDESDQDVTLKLAEIKLKRWNEGMGEQLNALMDASMPVWVDLWMDVYMD